MLCVTAMAFAVPAQRVAKVFKQADGTEITAMLVGDESFHFYQTADFVPLVRDAEGNFYYATISADRRLVSSNILAHNEAERFGLRKKRWKNLCAKIGRSLDTKGVFTYF